MTRPENPMPHNRGFRGQTWSLSQTILIGRPPLGVAWHFTTEAFHAVGDGGCFRHVLELLSLEIHASLVAHVRLLSNRKRALI